METILFNLIWVIPLLTVLVCIPIPATSERLLKVIHTASVSFVLLVVCALTYRVYALGAAPADPASAPFALRFFTDIPWLNAFNAHYIVGADGLRVTRRCFSP